MGICFVFACVLRSHVRCRRRRRRRHSKRIFFESFAHGFILNTNSSMHQSLCGSAFVYVCLPYGFTPASEQISELNTARTPNTFAYVSVCVFVSAQRTRRINGLRPPARAHSSASRIAARSDTHIKTCHTYIHVHERVCNSDALVRVQRTSRKCTNKISQHFYNLDFAFICVRTHIITLTVCVQSYVNI